LTQSTSEWGWTTAGLSFLVRTVQPITIGNKKVPSVARLYPKS
jgi:hypothetical protein